LSGRTTSHEGNGQVRKDGARDMLLKCADCLMENAHRIARSLEMGVAMSRGGLSSRVDAKS
jgi:hypothetical protein